MVGRGTDKLYDNIIDSENIDTSINKNTYGNISCVVPLRKELLSQSEKVYEGVAHCKGHTTTQMSSQQVV